MAKAVAVIIPNMDSSFKVYTIANPFTIMCCDGETNLNLNPQFLAMVPIFSYLLGNKFPASLTIRALNTNGSKRSFKCLCLPFDLIFSTYNLEFVEAIEKREPNTTFARKHIEHERGLSKPQVLSDGLHIEKAAVHFTHVHGDSLPPAATKRKPENGLCL